jgi:hypothetical protein
MVTPNKIVHFEIPADDAKRAKTFYEKAFGWRIEAYPMPGIEYYGVGTTPVDDKQMPTEVGGINGGLTKRNATLTHPVLTVDVPDIDRALSTIEKNGGKTLQKKQPIADMGFTAYFRDTEGNVVGLWQNAR